MKINLDNYPSSINHFDFEKKKSLLINLVNSHANELLLNHK